MADTPDTNEVRLHGQFTQVDENGDVTVLYPNTTVDDITGILPVEKGGTGSSTEQDFVQNIINNILNDNDLTNVSKLYSKFITDVDERPANLNSFTNPGWYYFTSFTAPEGRLNHPAIYNGDATEPTAGFLFVMTVRYKTCQFWISANYIGTTRNKKRCIYQREASIINSELSQNWSKWTYLHGDSNATQVYYVTYKGDNSIEYIYQDSYPGEAAIFKYETVDGSYTQHNGDIIIAECNFPETVKEIQLQIDDTKPTQIYTDSKGSSAVKLFNNNYKKITNGIYIFLYRTSVYYVIGQLHSTFNLATNGLVPKPDSTDTTKFLRGDGTWVIPDNTTYTLDGSYNDDDEWVTTLTPSVGEATSSTVPVMQGATSTESGSSGLVPAPNNPADRQKFLKGDGSWSVVHSYIQSVGTGLYRFSTDNEGHVVSTLEVTKSDITKLGIPSENTTYNVFSTSANGLVPKPNSTDTTKFLRGDGTWATVSSGGTYTHPSYTAKASGLYKITVDSTGHVSATTSVTKSDITSLNIPSENTTYNVFSTSANGLVPKPSSATTTKFLNANGGWTEPTGTYTHPSHTAKASGLYKITVDSTGHVSATTSVTNSDMTTVYGTGNNTHGRTSAFIVGNNNNVYEDSDTYRTYILGSANEIKQITSENSGESISNHGSVVIGFNNTINTQNHVFIAGYQNNVYEPKQLTTAAWTFGCGMGLNLPDHQGFYIGRYNKPVSNDDTLEYNSRANTAFCIGNGSGSDVSSRDNAFRITFTGATYGSSWNASGADYAEFVKPWFDGNVDNEDRVGYMVTIKDGYLHKANEGDYIIGITSGSPSIVGNADENYYWKYERDEFNRIVYELVDETKEETDENGNKLIVKTGNKINVPKVSSNYDPSLANSYVERKYRPEWSYVGMRGIVPVRDDGTCEAGGFCKCGTDGIATKSERGLDTYYVIERINDHVVSVEVK